MTLEDRVLMLERRLDALERIVHAPAYRQTIDVPLFDPDERDLDREELWTDARKTSRRLERD